MDSGRSKSSRRRSRRKSRRSSLVEHEEHDSARAKGTDEAKALSSLERKESTSSDDEEWKARERAEGEGMIFHENEEEDVGYEEELAKKNRQREAMEVAERRWKKMLEDEDEEDLRRSEGEGMLYDAVDLEDELEPMRGKAAAEERSERELRREVRRSESDMEAYERLKHEAEAEQKERELREAEEERLRQEEGEAEEDRLRMAQDWDELEREQEKEEEEKNSRELLKAAEEEAQLRQREMKEKLREREATEKMRREQEIDQLVTRQSLDIQNRRDELQQVSQKRMGPVRWVPDQQVAACQSCQEAFTLTKRRHHCRACGKIYCAKCSSKTSRVRWYEEPERVCDPCFIQLQGNLERKVVLMSGANSGVVAEVAEEMARQGAYLAILSPDAEEASALASRIQKSTGNTEVMPLWADFASLDSVHEAVERFRRQFDRIDVLINNCTVEPKGGREVHALTHDGNEKLFSLHYLSHFLVTYALLDMLKLSTPSRVINVCPKPSQHVHVNFDDFQMENTWSESRAVQQSRLGVYCMTRELGLRLKGSGVAVNVLDMDHVYSASDSFLRRVWCSIKGDTRDDEARNAYLYMAASPLTQEVSRGCFLPDGSPTLFKGATLDEGFCSHFYRASYDLVARWVAKDDRGGLMEGRMMESVLVERMRESTREREHEENAKLEIDVGSDLEEEEGKMKRKDKEVVKNEYGGVVEGGGVRPIMAWETRGTKKAAEEGDRRGRAMMPPEKKDEKVEVYAHHHKHHAATDERRRPSLELW